ncbi:RNA polymerase subunit sigma-70 [Actinokineospora sp.]|uniref:RNA polymerase subunit sigma-70 n=1 Tax=Actinokineospora sp. TaxID=1872133 RepID=UPI004037CBA2
MTAGTIEDDPVVAAATAGDETAFGHLVARHRRELQVHCYRMLGSFEDSEDLVQETFLRAWRKRDTYQGRATFRAWLYRIATNACLDHLDRNPRSPGHYPMPATAADPGLGDTPPRSIPWLQPYPDRLLDPPATEAGPDHQVVAKETIELAFLAAIQYLPPRQRAVLILRDVLGWSATDTATHLELTVAAVKSALQRARPTLRRHLPERRAEWAPTADPDDAERDLLRRYMAVLDDPTPTAFAEILRADVRVTMPPNDLWFAGRTSFVAGMIEMFDPASPNYFGEWRSVPTRANRQPAVANYVRRPGDTEFRAQVLDVLRVEDGMVAEITSFIPDLFPAFGLPMTL